MKCGEQEMVEGDDKIGAIFHLRLIRNYAV